MDTHTLYHGSPEIIQKPIYGKGKENNDYGKGFYCTEHLELAKEWACTEGIDGIANQYELPMDGLKILKLSDEEYTILHWLSLLTRYRNARISTPMMRKSLEWLHTAYPMDIREYDVIIGYRADDSYFSFARAFLNNEISLQQLSYAMRLGKLGEQIVLKSQKVFEAIRFCGFFPVDSAEYYLKRKARDESARRAYREELEKEDVNGLYIRDLIRGEVKPDDLRIR